ncbi:hypothetical protein M2480_000849 [Parabacteroides sp. PFB2-12]|uniref:hypothetical protein n=1 Tax=unclassified Parabacteroides TaxID=2649774 RepID=UPI0024750BE8|nr:MULTISPECIES: hypothetical protein [unclassified Parabacteroides]MDH6341694.1 hypothetical protein [Parabacteroides sp. PM6-13]MDH6389883.1 hypothetical protein [Parabacteroides sp. PFB2-12]
MRFLNVLLAVSLFLVAAVSCSMEDDMLIVASTSEAATVSADDTQLYVSFNVSGEMATRASSSSWDGEKMDTFENASVVVLEGNNVFFAKDNVTDFTSLNVLVKTGRTYQVYVIANTTISFASMTTKDQVEDVVYGAADLSNMVKFGKSKEFSFNKGQGFETIADAKNGNVETIAIVLKQLTAQVELVEFNSTITEGKEATVALTSVELINKNTTRKLNETVSSFTNEVVTAADFGKDAYASFVTYPNADTSNLTSLKLTFNVGEREEVRTYTINPNGLTGIGHNYVEAGNIYQLYVSVKVVGDKVECSVKCYTLDWQYNEFETTLVEVQ